MGGIDVQDILVTTDLHQNTGTATCHLMRPKKDDRHETRAKPVPSRPQWSKCVPSQLSDSFNTLFLDITIENC